MMNQFEVWKRANGERWLVCAGREQYDYFWGFWFFCKVVPS